MIMSVVDDNDNDNDSKREVEINRFFFGQYKYSNCVMNVPL